MAHRAVAADARRYTRHALIRWWWARRPCRVSVAGEVCHLELCHLIEGDRRRRQWRHRL